MKKLLFVLVMVLGIQVSRAECTSSGMAFFPQQKHISPITLFIIQGFSQSQETIESFKNRGVFLQAPDGSTVALTVVNIFKGQMFETQALFKPATTLQPNTKYVLQYANMTQNEERELLQWNPDTKKKEPVYWITDRIETSLPNIPPKITYSSSSVEYYGCGPAATVIFSISNPPAAPGSWYKTEVVDLDTNTSTTFYLAADKNQIIVGHGMCSGAFTFSKNGNYKVRFTPTTASGVAGKTTGWIAFKSPYDGKQGF